MNTEKKRKRNSFIGEIIQWNIENKNIKIDWEEKNSNIYPRQRN